MTQHEASGITPKVAEGLAEIDRHVEQIAQSTPQGSELNELAYAIHNLINCIRDIHGAG